MLFKPFTNKLNPLGRQLLIELIDCDPKLIDDVVYVEQSMEKAAEKAGATIINSTFHYFSPFGVSGVVVIQESHLAIHTWPEYGFAALDIFTCGNTIDPWAAYHLLKSSFSAQEGKAEEIQRGNPAFLKELIQKEAYSGAMKARPHQPIARSRDVWFTARNRDMAFSLKHLGEKLLDIQSPFQRIEVYPTATFGNMLTLDGRIMCTEKDERAYHEMLVHVPMLTHTGAPRRALVIGGGDGGTVRELLRHPSVEGIVLVEIDEQVIEASKKYLPTLGGALAHPKVTIKISDGFTFIQNLPNDSFDLVLVDAPCANEVEKPLFSEKFYQEVFRVLQPEGILVTQSESPYFNETVFKLIPGYLNNIFGKSKVYCYLIQMPTYPGGTWSFTYASKGNAHPLQEFREQKAESFSQNQKLKYYNAAIHKAAFALPNFVISLLDA